MTIHHNTLRKAQRLNIELTETAELFEDKFVIQGKSAKGLHLTSTDAKFLLSVLELHDTVLAAEYPTVSIRNDDLDTLVVRVKDKEIMRSNGDKIIDVAAVCEAAIDAGLTNEDLEEDDEPSSVNVIMQTYKGIYSERGNVNHCGDWLAKALAGQFDTVIEDELRFDIDAFTKMLANNGVEITGKWAELPLSGQRGWQGRYRMGGRLKLEKMLAKTGSLRLGNKEIEVPADALAELRQKHPKWDA